LDSGVLGSLLHRTVFVVFSAENKTVAFITLYAERKERFDNPQHPNNRHVVLYREIAEEMTLRFKVPMTGEEAKSKMDSLKSTYRAQQRANTSGAGSIRWPYFTMMRDLIGNQTVDHWLPRR